MRILREVTVEITQKCNSRCIFCSSLSEKSSENEIPLNKLLEIANFAKSKGAASVNISGGEPLLYKNLTQFLQFLKDIGLKSIIYTSGNADFSSLLKFLKGTNFSKEDIGFIFNYQSSDKAIFEKLTNTSGEFTLETINDNIHHCILQGYDVEAHIVPNEINISSIFETCKTLKTLGVTKVSLLRLVYQGRAENSKEKLVIRNDNALKDSIQLIEMKLCDSKFFLRIGVPYSNIKTLKTPCFALKNKIIIKYDGKVFPCEAFKEAPNNEIFILGDIYEDDMETIWKNENKELMHLKSRVAIESTCETCPAQLLYT